jgi:micrococcal nuclease
MAYTGCIMQTHTDAPFFRHTTRTLAIVAVVVLVSSGAYTGWQQYHSSNKSDTSATSTLRDTQPFTLVRVVDGDTIHVTDATGTKESIRLLGIDAPEIHYDTPEESDCYAWEAKEVLQDFLKDVDTVTVTKDPSQDTRDAYDRLLGYVRTDTLEDVNRLLIEFGAAREYTFKNRTYARQDVYKEREAVAQENGVGLWGCE